MDQKNLRDKKSKFAKEDGREKDRNMSKDKGKRNGVKDKPYLGKNNIAWRTNDETMTELVARLPFGVALGLSQQVTIGPNTATSIPVKLPGILVIRTRLTAGNSTGYNSPANLCFRKIYSYVRHANSGSRNYEASDMGLYFIALGQALGLLGWLQRVYRIVNEFSTTNRYTPARLLNAMGVDYSDIIANQPQLKYLIAWFGRAVGSLAFPDIPYFHACYEAYKWIIKDSDSPKEQFYIIDSKGFAEYDPVNAAVKYSTTAQWGNPDLTTPVFMKFQDIYDYVHEIMDVLLSDEDCGIISGDILKAYSDSGLFVPQAFGDYELFIKDPEILQQIHNAHVIPEDVMKLENYKQNSGTPNTAPYIYDDFQAGTGDFAVDSRCLGHHLFIDAFSKVPDAKEVVNCTVLNPVYKMQLKSGGSRYTVSDIKFDLHLPVEVYYIDNLTTNGRAQDLIGVFCRAYLYGSFGADELGFTNFDWHPIVFRTKTATGPMADVYTIGDVQNSRFFAYDIGDRIHANSTLSLFNFKENNFVK